MATTILGNADEEWPEHLLHPPVEPWQFLEADVRQGRGRPSHVRLWYHASEGVLTCERDGAKLSEMSFLNGTLRDRDFARSLEVIRMGEPTERGFAKVTDPFLGPLRRFDAVVDEDWTSVGVGSTRRFVRRRRGADMTELVINEVGLPISARFQGGLVRWIGLTRGTTDGPPSVSPDDSEAWHRETYRMLSREEVFQPFGGSAPEHVANLAFEDAFDYQSSRLLAAHRHVSWRSEGRELEIVIRLAEPADLESTAFNAGGWTVRLRGNGPSEDGDQLGWVAHVFAPQDMSREEAFGPLATLNPTEYATRWTLVDDEQSDVDLADQGNASADEGPGSRNEMRRGVEEDEADS